METNQLRQLQAIQAAGTLSAAARNLHMAQATLSRSIAKLESDLGVSLFERTSNSMTLSKAGHIALEEAEKILLAEQRMRDALSALANERKPFRVASVTPGPMWILTKIIAENVPSILLETHIFGNDEIEAKILDGSLDMGIVHTAPRFPKLASRSFTSETLQLYAPSNSHWACKSSTTFEEIDGEPIMILSGLGHWYDVLREGVPHSELIMQRDAEEFQRNMIATDLPCFTTELFRKRHPHTLSTARAAVTVEDDLAHLQYYITWAQGDNPSVDEVASHLTILD